MTKRIGVYPGTFDPITLGHIDIIQRAAPLVDHLIVAVAENAGKKPLFSLKERTEMAASEVKALGLTNVEVKPFSNLLIKFAQDEGAQVVIRGLRAVSDFEYEFQMAGANRKLAPKVETLFLMASDSYQLISSRFVKEIARMGGDISHFVSERVLVVMGQGIS
jgi:pantetheine-phosphate adenylyltransferase